MSTTRLSLLLVVGVAVAAAVARGRGVPPAAEADGQVYTVTGTVTAAPADGRVMVAHDDIPGFMPAMTMPFRLAPGTAEPPLAPGDVVRFRLRDSATATLAEAFVVTGHDARVAAAAAAAAAESRTMRRVKPGDRLPAFTLVDQAGAAFSGEHFRGRRTALTFIFTRCPVPEFCPLMIRRFQEVEAASRRDPALRDVQLVAVSLDPTFDTPAVLGAYAEAKRLAAPRWRLLTGEPDAVAAITKAFAVHVERNGVLLDHTLATAVVDGSGRVVELWRGNGWKASEVVDALRRTPIALETVAR